MTSGVLRNKASLIFLSLCCISLFFTLYFTREYYQTVQSLRNQAQQQAKKETIAAVENLDTFILSLKPLVRSLADELSSKKLTQNEIEQRLKQKPVSVAGMGVAFTPTIDPDKKRLYFVSFLKLCS